MKLKKLDLSGVKDYLFQKGERVGVVICAAIALLLLGIGLMKAGGSSTPYAKDFEKIRAQRDRELASTGNEKIEVPTKPYANPWQFRNVYFDHTSLFPYPDTDDNQRRNPTIFNVREDAKHIQIDYVRGGYLSYVLEKGNKVAAFDDKTGGTGKSGAAGEPKLVKIMKPVRMIVVSAVFPWKQQLEEYQRKLRYATMAELMAKPEDMPKPLGLNVFRCELLPDGKTYTKWEPVYKYEVDEDRVVVPDRIEELFKEAVIDEETPNKLGDHFAEHGLMTPLPLLANPNLQYPKPNLVGITLEEDKPGDKQPKGGRMPAAKGPMFWQRNQTNPGANEADAKPISVPWNELSQDKEDKFMGKIDFFDPYGTFEAKAEDPNAPVKPRLTKRPVRRPPPYGVRPGRPKKGTVAEEKSVDIADVLVRFIDVGVEPGKTYRYAFEVRMANPNFGNKEGVQFASLADVKELVSNWTQTPTKTIPDEYRYYAIDQKPDKQITGGSDDPKRHPAKADKDDHYGKWSTTVQVHRWIGKITDTAGNDWTVADWAIAERLLVRRGETIGRFKVMVEVPTWNKARETFEIGFEPQKVDAKKKEWRADTGLPISFIREQDMNNPPLLVDFEGGVKHNVRVGTLQPIVQDESAVDLLILTPDGKLVVRNSRVDTDLDYPVARERHDRYERWLKAVKEWRTDTTIAAPGKK